MISSLLKSTGFLVERKLSQDEIKERYNWIKSKQCIPNRVEKDRHRIISRVNFPDKFNGLYCAKFSPNGDTIVTTYGSGCIQLRNGETGDLRATIKSGLEMSLPVTSCRFHPINKQIVYATSACGSIFLCKIDKAEFWKFVEELDNEINAIDVNVSGDYIISGGKDAGVKVYDSETAKLFKNYKNNKNDLISENAVKFHHMRIFAVKCHQTNRNIVVTGGWDNTVKIWDIRVKNGCIRTIHGPHICGDAIDLRDRNILTGSWVVKNSLQIWDFMSGKLIETINPVNRTTISAGEFLYSAKYFDGDPYSEHAIIGGSAMGSIEIINLKKKKIAASFSANKPVMTIDSYKANIVYGGVDSAITLAECI